MAVRSQPYRLDFAPRGDLLNDEQQLGTVIESADQMFEILFTDLANVERAGGGMTLVAVTALIAAAIAALPPVIPPITGHYSVLTNGYVPAPELLFDLGDVIEVWVP